MERVALRCDVTPRSGAGHVARCLCLAAALQRRGANWELVGRREGAAEELVTPDRIGRPR
jgi:spore coat polysaccharide biosynthesis predicted glycosyltransferase SpsG